jgi:hypothetical protein
MKTRSDRGARNAGKSLRYLVFAVVGFAVLGAPATLKGGAVVEERVLCDNCGQRGLPCPDIASVASGEESDSMTLTRSQTGSDPNMQPIDASTAVVTRPATFALG